MNFKHGDILKVALASRSHEINPYYVIVIYANKNAKYGQTILETIIPDMWALKIKAGPSWDYHKDRFTKVGKLETHSHLLYNQNLVIKKKR